MKKALAFVLLTVLGLSAMACGDASASQNAAKSETLKYASISAVGYSAQYTNAYGTEVEAALQQGLTKAGFVNVKGSGISYRANAIWSENKDFVTICVTSQDNRITVGNDLARIMPGGCVNVSSKETGIENAIGVALLPKAGDKIAALLKDQIDGKSLDAPTTSNQPAKPANQAKTEPAANSNPANSKK